jgi:hypothetical protein
MAKNQIFRKIPDEILYKDVLSLFGIKDINASFTFTKKDLINLNVVDNINLIKERLSECYLPCKFKVYFNNNTEKGLITILRHMLKTRDLKLVSKEKYMKGEKYLQYKIESDKIEENNNLNKGSIIVRFD